MSLRLAPVMALALVALAAACGDGGGGIPDDPRVLKIGFVAEEAVYAYARSGASGLYPYLAQEVRDRCPEDRFAQALAGEEQPTGFRGLESVDFADTLADTEARVTVIYIVGGEDRDVRWVFVPGPEDIWYISEVPGIEECG